MSYLLIIDDDELICQNIKSKLSRLGYDSKYEILMTTDVREAEDLYDRYRPKVVITDIHMPIMSGLGLIRRLKEKEYTAHIFVLSGYDDYEYVRSAFLLGVTDYMVKPIHVDELNQKLSALEKDTELTATMTEKSVNLEETKSIIDAAVKFIEENQFRNITMKEVADHVCLSYNYFSKLFKENIGRKFNTYLHEKRLEQAKRYLDDPIIKVQDIAKRVGYGNANEFSRAFKKYIGVYPTEYRQQRSNKDL